MNFFILYIEEMDQPWTVNQHWNNAFGAQNPAAWGAKTIDPPEIQTQDINNIGAWNDLGGGLEQSTAILATPITITYNNHNYIHNVGARVTLYRVVGDPGANMLFLDDVPNRVVAGGRRRKTKRRDRRRRSRRN